MRNQSLSVSISEASIALGWIDECLACKLRNSYPVNNWASVNEVISQWAKAILDFANGSHFDKLNIAMMGPFDYENGISYIKDNRNLKSLYGQNLKELLAVELNISQQSIHFFNDAVCALAAENLPKQQRILGLYFDEGFGSAWLMDDEIKDAQLWKDAFLDGKTEDYFSVKWLRKAYFGLTGLSIANIEDINDFSSITGKELLKEFTDNLASYLVHLTKEIQFDAVLLGGSMLADKVSILAPLKKRLSTAGVNLSILKSQLGNQAPLIGTAVLAAKILLKPNY